MADADSAQVGRAGRGNRRSGRRHVSCTDSRRDHVLPIPIIVALAGGVLLLTLSYFGVPTLVKHRSGRLALLVGVVVLPMLLSLGHLSFGFEESSQTRF